MKILHKTITIFTLFALLLTASPPQPAYAATITVTNNLDSGAGSLRQAIADANAAAGADIITFAGDYAITLGSTLPTITSDLTIDGSGHVITLSGNSAVQVMNITSGTVFLNTLTITNGSTNDGAGIMNNGTLTITDSTFSNNLANNHGGGIVNNSTLTVTGSTFSNNSSDVNANGSGNGGAIVNDGTLTITDSAFDDNVAVHGGAIQNGGTLRITNSTFSDNIADINGSNIGHGGGINSSGTLLEITNSDFIENSAHYGGGIANDNGTLTVTGSTFDDNFADYGGGISGGGALTVTNSTFLQNEADYGGGGIRNGGTLIVTDCTFDNNGSFANGGGILNANTLTVADSTFDSNYAITHGGGIDNDNATLTITNSTFNDNSAQTQGGGMHNSAGSQTLTNVTFSDNEASSGGGMYNDSSDTTLTNVIIANSTSGGDCVGAGSTFLNPASSNNLIEDATNACGLTNGASGNIVGSAPNLDALADNGGSTQTMALLAGSPAIDQGTGCPATDQRGVLRPQGAACDIGAYEAGASILTVISSAPASGATLESLSSILVNFNEDALNDGSNKAANYAANYLLVERGINGSFDTISCAGGEISDDVKQIISSATYTNNSGSGPFSATLTLASPLADGSYRLFICGTTSIWSVAGLELNNGANDTTVDFTVQAAAPAPAPAALPATGFAMGRVTTLSTQPANKAYTETAMMLEIPQLGVSMPIVGVPQSESGWDVNWLGNSAGYLAGSAFPTWAGNTVITGHVWDAWNQPGAFAELKTLQYGDQVQIKAWGMTYTYEVRESNLVTTKNVNAVLQSEEYDWVTLVTCEFYNPFTGDYLFRRAVRAVLVSIQ